MTEEQYLSDRVDEQIDWYSAKSAINKKYYIWSNCLIIFFAAMIPFVSMVELENTRWPQYAAAFLGAITGTLTGISAKLGFQEKWTTYRITAESLRREKILYKTATGPYLKKGALFPSFVQNVERIMNNENTSWTEIMKRKDSEPTEAVGDTSVQ